MSSGVHLLDPALMRRLDQLSIAAKVGLEEPCRGEDAPKTWVLLWNLQIIGCIHPEMIRVNWIGMPMAELVSRLLSFYG